MSALINGCNHKLERGGLNMKKTIVILVTLIIGCAFYYGLQEVKAHEKEKKNENVLKPVVVRSISTSNDDKTLAYIGVIEPEILKNIGSKHSGKMHQVHVEAGDLVTKGQPLFSIDEEDLSLTNEVAVAEYEAAKTLYDKAKAALNFNQSELEKMKHLLNEGAISSHQLEALTMKYESAKSDERSAFEMINKAKVGLNHSGRALSETTVYSDMDGYVVQVFNKPGELIASGYPVLTVRSKDTVAKVGISQEDVSKIDFNTAVELVVDGETFSGSLEKIAHIPNVITRTYEAEVKVINENSSDAKVGALTDVNFIVGQYSGVKVPLKALFLSRSTFLYTVEEETVRKMEVEIEDIIDDEVYINGLNEGDRVVISGMKRIQDGETVTVYDEVVEDAGTN